MLAFAVADIVVLEDALLAETVLIADSRVKDFRHPEYRQIARHASCTLPNLDESPEFRDVRIYQAGS
jgi:hypothetical protein